MLAYFPPAYPDELFLSVISRLAEMMQYPHQGYLSKEIFGRECKFIDATLATHLEWLLTTLPPGHDLTAGKIIQEQTLFPYYQPFVSPQRAQKVKDKMIQTNPHNRYQSIALSRWEVPEPKWLRFCYDCLIADRKQYGQAYWHRVHQAPGVKVCPHHGTIVQDSQVAGLYRPPNQRYCSAEQALTGAGSVPNSFSPDIRQILGQIARDAAWLLQHDNNHLDPAAIRARFRRVLIEQELSSHKGRMYVAKFLRMFKAYYDPELLNLLGCSLDHDNFMAWPVRTIQKKTNTAKHPLQQLLVIQALGYDVETFFALPTQVAYFGRGPWPCLNPVCDAYRQAVVETYHLDYQKGYGRPRATFACRQCGFTYRRLGPDTSSTDRYRFDRVLARGPLWEARLAQLRADPTVGPAEMARQLNTNPTTVATYVIASRENREAKRDRYRAIWLEALARFPEARIGELNHHPEFSSVYNWLIRHDREWYKAHCRPGRRQRRELSPRRSTLDDRYRQTRDGLLAEDVRLTAEHLLAQAGKPQKLTQSAICYHLNLGGFLPKPQALPLTAQTLRTVAEPHEVFVGRRLLWAVADCRRQGLCPTRYALIFHTGLTTFFYKAHKQDRELGQTMLDRLEDLHPAERLLSVYDLLPAMARDWLALDARLAEAVAQTARRLKDKPDYPLRATVSTIGRELDQLENLLRHLVMLPQTAQVLTQVTETDVVFAQRVLTWIDRCEPDAQKCRMRNQFLKVTGLQSYDHLPAVTHLIDEAFTRLQAQIPKAQPTIERQNNVDWQARDKILAPAIRQAAQTLKERAEIQITAKSISQVLDERQLLPVFTHELLTFQQRKLLQTAQVLQEVVETPEQFTQRRLLQLADQFRQKGLRPTKTQLRATVNDQTLKASPLLQQTFNDIVASLAHLPSAFEASLQQWWTEIDTELAPLVEPAARHLKAQTDPFVWVSKSAVATYLGQYRRIVANLEKLPETAQELAQVVETREEFALRRIQWWEAYHQNRQIRPQKWQFITDAGVDKAMHRHAIRMAVDKAIQTLSIFPTQWQLERKQRSSC